jgi:hypothetical protein
MKKLLVLALTLLSLNSFAANIGNAEDIIDNAYFYATDSEAVVDKNLERELDEMMEEIEADGGAEAQILFDQATKAVEIILSDMNQIEDAKIKLQEKSFFYSEVLNLAMALDQDSEQYKKINALLMEAHEFDDQIRLIVAILVAVE